MASTTPEPVGTHVGSDSDRVAALEAELARSERRREAAEEWGEFLAAELEARDELLECVIEQYEAQLSEAKAREPADESPGRWARFKDWFRLP